MHPPPLPTDIDFRLNGCIPRRFEAYIDELSAGILLGSGRTDILCIRDKLFNGNVYIFLYEFWNFWNICKCVCNRNETKILVLKLWINGHIIFLAFMTRTLIILCTNRAGQFYITIDELHTKNYHMMLGHNANINCKRGNFPLAWMEEMKFHIINYNVHLLRNLTI